MLVYPKDGRYVVLDFSDYYVQEEWYGAEDTLCFNLPDDHPQLFDMVAQLPIIDKETGQKYIITSLDDGDVAAALDLDELKSDIYLDFSNESDSAYGTIQKVLPSSWSIHDHAQITTRRTIDMPGATCLDIINECADTWNLAIRFDNASRIVHLYRPEDNEATGSYFSEELNLRRNPIHSSSTRQFATRLYAVGRDGITFAAINGGKSYIDNNEYSDRVICAFWKDERYTVPENLLEDAREKLAKMAKPEESYQCDVIDLAKIDPAHWGQLSVSLYNGVILMDGKRGTRMVHRVVRYKRYPNFPEKNVITLSSVPGTLSKKVAQSYNAVTNPNSSFQQQHQLSMQQAIRRQTELITGNRGGYVVLHDGDGDGFPDEQLVMDTPSIETATRLWRWNLAGLGYSGSGYNGPYKLGMTMDGQIVADLITTGTLDASLVKVVHLSAGSIESGTLTLGGVNNTGALLSILDNAGKETGRIDNNGLRFTRGSVELGGGAFSVDDKGHLVATDANISGGAVGGWSLSATRIRSSATIYSGAREAGLLLINEASKPFLLAQNASGQQTFAIDRDGNATFAGALSAATGTFAGELQAARGTFSGELSAATGTFAGELQAARGTFSGELSAATGSFSGKIEAGSGHIGDWEITGGSITNGLPYTGAGDSNATGMGAYGTDWAFWAGNGRFSVNQAGHLYAVDADITGTITATSGSFTGIVYATDGYFAGTVYANRIAVGGDYGYIQGSQVGANTLTGGNIGQSTLTGWNIGGDTVTRGNLQEKYATSAQFDSLSADVASIKVLTNVFTASDAINVRAMTVYGGLYYMNKNVFWKTIYINGTAYTVLADSN